MVGMGVEGYVEVWWGRALRGLWLGDKGRVGGGCGLEGMENVDRNLMYK